MRNFDLTKYKGICRAISVHFCNKSTHFLSYLTGFVQFQLDLVTVNGNNVFCLGDHSISTLNTNNQMQTIIFLSQIERDIVIVLAKTSTVTLQQLDYILINI